MIKRSYLLTRVMGIPVRIHITLIILLIVVTFYTGAFGLLYAAAVFASVAVHELGHSWVAIRKGCRVHEIMLLPIGGVAKINNLPARPRDEFLVAAAGPAAETLQRLFGARPQQPPPPQPPAPQTTAPIVSQPAAPLAGGVRIGVGGSS